MVKFGAILALAAEKMQLIIEIAVSSILSGFEKVSNIAKHAQPAVALSKK